MAAAPTSCARTAYLRAARRSASQREGRFLLRKDGTWVLNLAVFVLPQEEQEEQFVYGNITEVMETLQSLMGQPLVDESWPEGKSREEVRLALHSTHDRLWSRIREAKGSKITM